LGLTKIQLFLDKVTPITWAKGCTLSIINLNNFKYMLIVSICLSIYMNYFLFSYFLLTLLTLNFFFLDFKNKEKESHTNNLKNYETYIEAFEQNLIFAKLSPKYKVIYANRQFCQVLHTTKKTVKTIYLNKSLKENIDEINETLKHNQSWEGKVTILTKEGGHFLESTFIPINDKNEKLKEILFLAKDITELNISQIKIKNSLYIDSLTKLPNRLKLFTDKSLPTTNKVHTYIIVNIDSFDSINNLYGNSYGDEILKKVARWLEKNSLTENTKLYKLEADIYAMVCYDEISEDELRNYLTKISKKILEEKFLCNETEIDISFTIGASQGVSNLQQLSQIAYKEAKLSKKAFAIYDKQSNKEEEYIKNIHTSKLLKDAYENNNIIPYFQPILNLKTQQIEKYETLMRVVNQDGKVLSPNEFLNIAKQSKIYPKLSKQLIKKSVDYFLISPCEFSINLSYLDIVNKNTKKFILELLESTGIGPWMIFEILESEGIENYKDAMGFIEDVKSYGAKIAIDDFGSGYSNFEIIVELQIDYLKIDGSLIKNIHINDDVKIIVKTITNFAKELNIKTVAEFVHSNEILDVINELGVDFAQGYYIGKPDKYLQ